MYCTGTLPGQAGESAITRRPSAFTVTHAISWARPSSRRGFASCSTRSGSIAKFCKWSHQLGADSGVDAEEEPLGEEEDAAGGSIEEFDRLDMSGGIDGIADEDLFDKAVVDEGSIFD
jgi:hypothetical protein